MSFTTGVCDNIYVQMEANLQTDPKSSIKQMKLTLDLIDKNANFNRISP